MLGRKTRSNCGLNLLPVFRETTTGTFPTTSAATSTSAVEKFASIILPKMKSHHLPDMPTSSIGTAAMLPYVGTWPVGGF